MSDYRILIVSQYFHPEEFLINDFANELKEQNCHVEVLTGQPNYPSGKLFQGHKNWGANSHNFKTINVHRVPIIPRGIGPSWLGLVLNYLSFIVTGCLIGPYLLRGKKFDFVFVFGVSPILQALPAIFISKLKNAKLGIWVQDLWPGSLRDSGYVKNIALLKLVEKIVTFIYKKADIIFAQSNTFVKHIGEQSPTSKVVYLPNCMRSDEFNLASASSYPAVQGMNESFSVLFAGNIGTAQDINTVIEAANIIRDSEVTFFILGDGSLRQEMMKKAADLELNNIYFPGRHPRESIPLHCHHASILLATLTDRESFSKTVPSKIQAYLASGKPIIASIPGEGRKIVETAQAGLCVPPECPEKLAAAITALYESDKNTLAEMGRNGRAYFEENFILENRVSEFINLVQKLNMDEVD